MSRSAGSDDRGYADFAAHGKPGRPKRGWRHPDTAKTLRTSRARILEIVSYAFETDASLSLAAILLSREADAIRKAAENENLLKGLDK